ncbi:hypothetical protein [Acinetobacter sp. NIPH 2100]|uniref:hypothetical protein n=1 Tax=Acinetobacter sp. NIPH 2100 TaxID=1217708 RepID=UPI0002D0A024|nr:hypothetical protein [Acinetobacter sp. NIPH 2100]ENX41321.1 hypothetical protein F887_01717 [Acinetobacter sp. NIPH 2100]
MLNFKTLLVSTILLATTVPAFAAGDCCKEKDAANKKECCEKKMKCCDDKDKKATQEDHSHRGH